VLGEGGFLSDPRCDEALALLEAKRRPDGGFAAEERFWAGPKSKGRQSLVSWGRTGKSNSNEFVTADALWVLAQKRNERVKRLEQQGRTARATRTNLTPEFESGSAQP
jgi:hypothetical protein